MLVLDKVNFLFVDETFGPQLKTVEVAVGGGGRDIEEVKDGNDDNGRSLNGGLQYVIVTATLPEDGTESI